MCKTLQHYTQFYNTIGIFTQLYNTIQNSTKPYKTPKKLTKNIYPQCAKCTYVHTAITTIWG